MTVETKKIALPDESLNPKCPQCGGSSSRETQEVFECGTCGFLFEAAIELSWVKN